MSAREELYAAVMSGGEHSPGRSERASARIDAYRAEVLREAAEKAAAFTDQWSDMDAMKAAGIVGPFTALGRLSEELDRMASATP